MSSQRLKILQFNTHGFLMLMKHGSDYPVRVSNPLPSDTVIVRVYQENIVGDINLIIASESFPELKDGDVIPMLLTPPIFEKIR